MTESVVEDRWSRICHALSLLAVGLTVAAIAGIPLAGVLTGGTLRANIAFALVASSILVVIAVLLSYGASFLIQRISRAAWLIVAIACLGFTQYILTLGDPEAQKAADTVLLIAMLCLTFPLGSIAIGIAFLYSSLLLSSRGVNPFDLMILWSAFAVAGYFQWFKILPRLVSKLRARKSIQ